MSELPEVGDQVTWTEHDEELGPLDESGFVVQVAEHSEQVRINCDCGPRLVWVPAAEVTVVRRVGQ